jgi:hypothetical protein
MIAIEGNQLKLQDASTDYASILRRISILLSCPHLLVLGSMETASSSIDKSELWETRQRPRPNHVTSEVGLGHGLNPACTAHAEAISVGSNP